MDQPPRPDPRPVGGRPHASAEARFRAGLRAELERAGLAWAAGLLGADAALDERDRDAAVRSLDDQRDTLRELHRELDRVVAAAVREREATTEARSPLPPGPPSVRDREPRRDPDRRRHGVGPRSRRGPSRPRGATLAVGAVAVAVVTAGLVGLPSAPAADRALPAVTTAEQVMPRPAPPPFDAVWDGWSATARPPVPDPTVEDPGDEHLRPGAAPVAEPGSGRDGATDGPEAATGTSPGRAARIAPAEDPGPPAPSDPEPSTSPAAGEPTSPTPTSPSPTPPSPDAGPVASERGLRRLPLPRLSDLTGRGERTAADGAEETAGAGPLDLLGRLLGG